MAQNIFDAFRGATPPRGFLLGACLMGISQQGHAIARNIYLTHVGWAPNHIPFVQAVESFAAVLAGVAAVVLTKQRIPATSTLIACALSLPLGLALPVCSSSAPAVFIGAAVVGFAAYLPLCVIPNLLRGLTAESDRVTGFSATTIALSPLAGIIAAGLLAVAGLATPILADQLRAILLIAGFASAAAVLPLSRLSVVEERGTSLPSFQTRGCMKCAAVHGLVGFAGGLTAPYWQMSLIGDAQLSARAVAVLNGAAMATSFIALGVLPSSSRRFGPVALAFVAQLAVAVSLVGVSLPLLRNVRVAAMSVQMALTASSTTLLHQLYQRTCNAAERAVVGPVAMASGSFSWMCGSAVAGVIMTHRSEPMGLMFGIAALAQGAATTLVLAFFSTLWRERRPDGSRDDESTRAAQLTL